MYVLINMESAVSILIFKCQWLLGLGKENVNLNEAENIWFYICTINIVVYNIQINLLNLSNLLLKINIRKLHTSHYGYRSNLFSFFFLPKEKLTFLSCPKSHETRKSKVSVDSLSTRVYKNKVFFLHFISPPKSQRSN